MFESVTDFTTTISAYEIPIPYSVQVGIIVCIIVGLSLAGYFLRESFDLDSMRDGFSWFIFIAVLNLITILAVFIYYNSTTGKFKGPIGNPGKKGTFGKKGTSVSCNYCKNNIYLQRAKYAEKICNIPAEPQSLKYVFDYEDYFNRILGQGNTIDYSSFINNIILNQRKSSTNQTAINNFQALMNPTHISILLIKAINNYTKSSDSVYCSFRQPGGVQKYLPLGNSVYGGIEDDLELNSFMISGNILFPESYTKLLSFKGTNNENGALETYTIWRPNGQTINEVGFKNTRDRVTYKSVGDICRYGTRRPRASECPTISEKCLEEVDVKDIDLVFIGVNNIQMRNELSTSNYTQSDSYLISSVNVSDIEVFSVWRTPLNTFITNCNTKYNQSENKMVNNTVIYNIVNNLSGSLNNYGNVSTSEKNRISSFFETIKIPKIVVALILCYYYQVDLIKDLVYYITLAKNLINTNGTAKLPEFQVNISSLNFGDLMNLIANTKKSYDTYNANLVRNLTTEAREKAHRAGKKRIKKKEYDASKEKHIPSMLLNVYNDTNSTLLTLPIKIENTNTLLDILNVIFENGIESRIAVDSDGILQGGTFMNSIQEMILLICKMLTPPNIPAYTIKDECLGTFPLDREREEVINDFTDILNTYKKLLETINQNENNMYDVVDSISAVSILRLKMGQLCGHIKNFENKILSGNLKEITTTRIKGLMEIFTETINNLQNQMTASASE
jgi:hypothetical protein